VILGVIVLLITILVKIPVPPVIVFPFILFELILDEYILLLVKVVNIPLAEVILVAVNVETFAVPIVIVPITPEEANKLLIIPVPLFNVEIFEVFENTWVKIAVLAFKVPFIVALFEITLKNDPVPALIVFEVKVVINPELAIREIYEPVPILLVEPLILEAVNVEINAVPIFEVDENKL
jgi:hypothetical protein